MLWLHSQHHHQGRLYIKYTRVCTGAYKSPLDCKISEDPNQWKNPIQPLPSGLFNEQEEWHGWSFRKGKSLNIGGVLLEGGNKGYRIPKKRNWSLLLFVFMYCQCCWGTCYVRKCYNKIICNFFCLSVDFAGKNKNFEKARYPSLSLCKLSMFEHI